MGKTVRIGCASGRGGDSAIAAAWPDALVAPRSWWLAEADAA